MPLQLSDDEMSVLMSLAPPIDQRLRPQFLQEVAAELEAKRQAGELARARCIGWRVRFSGSTGIRRNCATQARWRAPKGRSSNLEHYGDAAIIALSSVLAFSHRQRRSPTKARWVAGMRCC